MNNLKDIFDQPEQPICANNSEHPTCTIAKTFQKPAGEANTYFLFRYGPQKICDTPKDKFQNQ